MIFQYPKVLWALLALLIPILIHLFYFRRYKKQVFTNVSFLSEIIEEKSLREKLRKLLILLCRLAAMAFLIFAFANPFLPGSESRGDGKKIVSIYIDNSYSMEAYGQNASLLEEAKRVAGEIISAYAEDTEFQLLPNSTSAIYQRLHSAVDAGNLLEEIEVGGSVMNMSEIQALQYQALKDYEKGEKNLYYISDFQKRTTDFSMPPDSLYKMYAVPLKSESVSNISLDSAWMESPTIQPGQVNPIFVELSNRGDEDIENVRITSNYKGNVRPSGTIEIPAGAKIQDTISFVPEGGGWQSISLNVKDYPIEFDNTLYMAFNVPEKLRVLFITENGSRKSLMNSENMKAMAIDFTDKSTLDYSSFSTYELIVLEDLQRISEGMRSELDKHVANGGKLLVFPASEIDRESYERLFRIWRLPTLGDFHREEMEVFAHNEKSFVFSNVYHTSRNRISLPKVKAYYEFVKSSTRPNEWIMSMRNRNAFMSQYTQGRGLIYLCASPLAVEYNNLIQRGDVFAPMLYRMALQGTINSELYKTIGSKSTMTIKNTKPSESENPIVLKDSENREYIPAQSRTTGGKIMDFSVLNLEAGLYEVEQDDTPLNILALNDNREESDMDFYSESDLEQRHPFLKIIPKAKQSNLVSYLSSTELGKELWWYCIIIVLVFLALEQLLIRFYRK